MAQPFSEVCNTTSLTDAQDIVRYYLLAGIPAWYAVHGSPESYVVYAEELPGKPF